MIRCAVRLLALLALAGCGGDDETTAPTAGAADGVQELANVLQLRSDFEADAGNARLILLFSPT